MQLYAINNSLLPLNTFTIDMQLPYQEANNIAFNLASDQTDVGKKVDGNAEYAKLLESKFIIDTSQNEFLKQDLQNMKLSCLVKLIIDPQPIKDGGVNPTQQQLDGLITETSEQRVIFDLDYSNYYQIKKDATIKNNYSYSLSRGSSSCFSKVRLININSNDYSSNSYAINELATIASDTLFQVLIAKVKFYYWLDYEQEEKTLEFDLDISKQATNLINIDLNQNTIYDFINNKVVIDPSGIQGFYIPKYAKGHYELNLKICQDNIIHTFQILNDFVFNENINNPYVAITSTRIEDLDGFKEVI